MLRVLSCVKVQMKSSGNAGAKIRGKMRGYRWKDAAVRHYNSDEVAMRLRRQLLRLRMDQTKTSQAEYLLPGSLVHRCPQPRTGQLNRLGFFGFLGVASFAVAGAEAVGRLREDVLEAFAGGSSSGGSTAFALPLPLPEVLSATIASGPSGGAIPLSLSTHRPSITCPHGNTQILSSPLAPVTSAWRQHGQIGVVSGKGPVTTALSSK